MQEALPAGNHIVLLVAGVLTSASSLGRWSGTGALGGIASGRVQPRYGCTDPTHRLAAGRGRRHVQGAILVEKQNSGTISVRLMITKL